MTDEEAQRIQAIARSIAFKWHRPELADDFAQEAVIARLRYPGLELEYAFINLLRKEYGSSRLPSGRARQIGTARAIELDAPVASQDPHKTLNHDLVGDTRFDPRSNVELGRVLDLCDREERILLVLRYVWEFTESEIAYCFGLTETRICQRLGSLQEGLPRRMEKQKQRKAQRVLTKTYEETSLLARIRSVRAREMAEALPKEDRSRPKLEQFPNQLLAEIKPWQMALDYEACFAPWLVSEIV